MVTQVVNKNTQVTPRSGGITSVTPFFLISTQRTEFLSYFVDIISHLDRMFLCKISFFQRHILFQEYLISFVVFYVILFRFLFLFSLIALTA